MDIGVDKEIQQLSQTTVLHFRTADADADEIK